MRPPKIYRAAAGARFSHKKAQVYGEWLEQLEAKLGHPPSTDEIWQAARSPRSPAYHFFEWNVKKAALAHWRAQARNLVNHLEVVIVAASGRQQPCRARFNIQTSSGVSFYPAVAQVTKTKFMREQIIEYAKREANEWRRKYELYSRFSPVIRLLCMAIKKAAS